MSHLVPFAPGTVTRQDQYGNVTGVKANIRDADWEAIGVLEEIMALPTDPIANMWEASAAAPPPSPWAAQAAPPVVQKMSFQGQGRERGPTLCDLLGLVPGLGVWAKVSCTFFTGRGLMTSLATFFKSFQKHYFAIYLGRQVLTVVGQEALDEFMGGSSRKMRDKLRIRRSR